VSRTRLRASEHAPSRTRAGPRSRTGRVDVVRRCLGTARAGLIWQGARAAAQLVRMRSRSNSANDSMSRCTSRPWSVPRSNWSCTEMSRPPARSMRSISARASLKERLNLSSLATMIPSLSPRSTRSNRFEKERAVGEPPDWSSSRSQTPGWARRLSGCTPRSSRSASAIRTTQRSTHTSAPAIARDTPRGWRIDKVSPATTSTPSWRSRWRSRPPRRPHPPSNLLGWL